MAWDDDDVVARILDETPTDGNKQTQKQPYMLTSYQIELRDKLAESTMVALLDEAQMYELDGLDDDGCPDDENRDKVNQIARISYEMADAMLRAREK